LRNPAKCAAQLTWPALLASPIDHCDLYADGNVLFGADAAFKFLKFMFWKNLLYYYPFSRVFRDLFMFHRALLICFIFFNTLFYSSGFLDQIAALDNQSAEVLAHIRELVIGKQE
jgi:hypothetical protein